MGGGRAGLAPGPPGPSEQAGDLLQLLLEPSEKGASIPWGPWDKPGHDQDVGASNHQRRSSTGASFPVPTLGALCRV